MLNADYRRTEIFTNRSYFPSKESHFFSFSSKKLILTLTAILVILLSLQLLLSNYLSTKGQKVWDLDQKTKVLEEESLVLKTQIAKLSSLKTVSEKATKLGLKKSDSFVYIQDQTSLAFKR